MGFITVYFNVCMCKLFITGRNSFLLKADLEIEQKLTMGTGAQCLWSVY